MKLIIQIPCLNEEKTLPITVADIPRQIDGIDEVEILIINDGSTDRTVEIAGGIGVDHIISFPNTRGLARGFMAGLDACLRLGADIIVNTDGDNQYKGSDIPKLIKPILERKADIVVGDRQIESIEDFSFMKKKLQRIGSWVVRQLSETTVTDTTSGFRAISREAALRINIVSPFSYTLETVIQAGKKHMGIANVPIGTNSKLRESRLFKSIPKYIQQSCTTMLRIYSMYQPLRTFFYIGGLMFFIGFLIGLRFLCYYFGGSGGAGHLQSLILAAVLLILGFTTFMIGLVADIISFNRRLIEETLYKVRSLELNIREMRVSRTDLGQDDVFSITDEPDLAHLSNSRNTVEKQVLSK